MVYLGDKCLIPTECPASREGREKEKRGPKNIKSTELNLYWYPLAIHSEGICQERCCIILPVTGSETLFKGGRVTWCWWSPAGCMMTSQANCLRASGLLEKLKSPLGLSNTWQQCLRWLWVLQLLGFQVLGVFWVWPGLSSCAIPLPLADADKAGRWTGSQRDPAQSRENSQLLTGLVLP